MDQGIINVAVNEHGIADIKKVKLLLDSDIPGNQIEKYTGISRSLISKYRKEDYNIKNMSLETAITLTRYSENQINMNANNILQRLKFSKELEFRIRISKKNNAYLTNKDTNNYQSIFSRDLVEGNRLYGAYGDVVGMSQVDNRHNTDEEILSAIKKLLNQGTPIEFPLI